MLQECPTSHSATTEAPNRTAQDGVHNAAYQGICAAYEADTSSLVQTTLTVCACCRQTSPSGHHIFAHSYTEAPVSTAPMLICIIIWVHYRIEMQLVHRHCAQLQRNGLPCWHHLKGWKCLRHPWCFGLFPCLHCLAVTYVVSESPEGSPHDPQGYVSIPQCVPLSQLLLGPRPSCAKADGREATWHSICHFISCFSGSWWLGNTPLPCKEENQRAGNKIRLADSRLTGMQPRSWSWYCHSSILPSWSPRPSWVRPVEQSELNRFTTCKWFRKISSISLWYLDI